MTTKMLDRRSDGVANLSITVRRFCAELVERCFTHLDRKPQAVYDMREGKATPFPARHLADYRRALANGANPDEILNAHTAIGAELEQMTASAQCTAGRAFPTASEVHRAEFVAECQANPVQLLLQKSDLSLPDLYAVRDVTIPELLRTKQLLAWVNRAIAKKELLERHVGRAISATR